MKIRTTQVEVIVFKMVNGQPLFLLLKRNPRRGGFWQPITGGVHDEEKLPDAREGFYANQEVATLLYQAAINPDQAARQTIYEQVEQLLFDDTARIWIAHNNTPLIFAKGVSGYIPQPVGADYFEFVTIEP